MNQESCPTCDYPLEGGVCLLCEEESQKRKEIDKYLTNSLKKRMVSDYALPITVFEEPHFSYQRGLYSLRYGVDLIISCLIEEIKKHGGEDQFFQWEASVRKAVIDKIQEKESYKKFNSQALPQIKFEVFDRLYIQPNHDCIFVSFDMVKANFQALRHFDPDIFDNQNNWPEYLSQFSTSMYLMGSKRFRQIIFGNLNPKRQQAYQKVLISKVLSIVERFDLGEVCFTSPDEFVVKVNPTGLEEKLSLIKETIDKETGLKIRVTQFKLKQLKPFSYFVKVQDTDSVIDRLDIKCVPSVFFAQAFKRAYSLYQPEFPGIPFDIIYQDLAFYFEKRLAYFEKSLEFIN